MEDIKSLLSTFMVIACSIYSVVWGITSIYFTGEVFYRACRWLHGLWGKRYLWQVSFGIAGLSLAAGLCWIPNIPWVPIVFGAVCIFSLVMFIVAPIYYWIRAFDNRALRSRNILLVGLFPLFLISILSWCGLMVTSFFVAVGIICTMREFLMGLF